MFEKIKSIFSRGETDLEPIAEFYKVLDKMQVEVY